MNKAQLLKPLQWVCGSLGGRLSAPILSHVLLEVREGALKLTATDTEVEMAATAPVIEAIQAGAVAVPGRKVLEITRMLPETAPIRFTATEGRFEIEAERSRLSLVTLPSNSFPTFVPLNAELSFALPQATLLSLIESTAFSMAHQDVRYYLNGLLLELSAQAIRAVSTDGHRLALHVQPIAGPEEAHAVLLPRKAVLELLRLLDPSDQTPCQVRCGHKALSIETPQIRFSSRLIGGQFPEYQRIFSSDYPFQWSASVPAFRQALMRAAVLSHEKLKTVRWSIAPGELTIMATNAVTESAEESITIQGYEGALTEIGFNVSYLLDILNIVKEDRITVRFRDPYSGVLFSGSRHHAAQYVVMPIRL